MNSESKQELFLKVFEPVHLKLDRYVSAIVRNRTEAKDIISETILRTYENFEKINKPESLMYYMFRVAQTLISRKHRKDKFWGDYDDNAINSIADESADSTGKIKLKEFYAALNTIPEKQKEAIVLFELSGMSLNEIQKIQGGSLSGVKSRIARARVLLEHKLEYKKNAFNTEIEIK